MNWFTTYLAVHACCAVLCHGLYCHMSWVAETNNMTRKGHARQALLAPICLFILLYICLRYETIGFRLRPWKQKI